MAILRPDEYRHNNPELSVVDSDNSRGSTKIVADQAAMLTFPVDKLKNGSKVKYKVGSDYLEWELQDISNTTNITSWKQLKNLSSEKYQADLNNNAIINPYQFGAKGDNVTNDTTAIQESIDFAIANDKSLEIIGTFLSDTLVINNNLSLYTDCTIQTINDVDVLHVIGRGNGYGSVNETKLKHTGNLTLRGVSREGNSKALFLSNGCKDSSLGNLYIDNVALGIGYGNTGNNNGVEIKSVEIKSTSKSYFTTYVKVAETSPSFLNDIGEITTPVPINTSTGFIAIGNLNGGSTALDTDCKTYPIVEKPGSVNTYYVGGYSRISDGLTLAHWNGGGIHHTDHTDNGAVTYGKLSMISIDGFTLNVQSFYGITVNSGHLEGAYTNINIGGIRIGVDNVTPEIIFSIRNYFTGLHTEAFLSQEPLVYTLAGSKPIFDGNLMAKGIRTLGPGNGVKYNSKTGSDRVSNVYYIEGDAGVFQPIDPTFEIYREVAVDRVTFLTLNDLSTDMEYLGDPRVSHLTMGKVNLLNIPAGAVRRITVTPTGTNTLMGGTDPINIDITGVEGHTINTVYFLLEGNNFIYYKNQLSLSNFQNRIQFIFDPTTINVSIIASLKDKLIVFTTPTPITCTIDTGSLATVGDTAYIEQYGEGEVVLLSGVGTTLLLNENQQLSLNGRYSRIGIQKTDVATYRVFGDLKDKITKASLNGDPLEVFKVADPIANEDSVNLQTLNTRLGEVEIQVGDDFFIDTDGLLQSNEAELSHRYISPDDITQDVVVPFEITQVISIHVGNTHLDNIEYNIVLPSTINFKGNLEKGDFVEILYRTRMQ